MKILGRILLAVRPLPYGMWRAYRYYFFTAICYFALATAYVTSDLKRFVIVSYTFALVLFVLGLRKKMKIIAIGYKEVVLRANEYTFLRRRMADDGTPTGVLLSPMNNEGPEKRYHLALRPDNIPKIGSIVHIYVPKNVKEARYENRFYFPIVYDYIEEESE